MSKRNLLLLVLLIGVLMAVIPAFAADSDVQAPAKAPANDIYIVQMVGNPVGAYTGGVAGPVSYTHLDVYKRQGQRRHLRRAGHRQ